MVFHYGFITVFEFYNLENYTTKRKTPCYQVDEVDEGQWRSRYGNAVPSERKLEISVVCLKFAQISYVIFGLKTERYFLVYDKSK